LKVEVEISEVDIAKIKLGLEAEIKLDAFSDTVYKGKVISVANLAQFKERDSKIKIFPVEVLLDETSGTFLPGMTVSCRIIVNRIEDVLYIPLESMFLFENDRFVYVKSGGSFEQKKIETSEKNNDYIVVQDGLEEGELIAMSNPYPEENIQPNPK
jgi:multidrug efflux pump subunit AcrA (membrane-fusion protein)